MPKNALAGYSEAFYDRSREPIANNALGVRYGDLLPYYGNALGYDDARLEFQKGNYGQAALGAAMTALPWGTLLARGGNALRRIVDPESAKALNYESRPSQNPVLPDAIANTPGAQMTPDGLQMQIMRNQLPEQVGQPSVRGGVFYLPEGAAQGKHYTTGKNGYGGPERIQGESLFRAPLVAKGGTGGKAPQTAYDELLGKGSYEAMRTDALKVRLNPDLKGAIHPDDFLRKYAPDLEGQGEYIYRNSRQGNQLAYALQEAAVGSAVRKAGYDSVIGHSKGKSGPFISEVFDVREANYPGQDEFWLHDQFESK